MRFFFRTSRDARCFNVCAYCGGTSRKLTKEHLIPRSKAELLECPQYQIRLVCRRCNGRRGASDTYVRYPSLQRTVVTTLLRQKVVNDALLFKRVLQTFAGSG